MEWRILHIQARWRCALFIAWDICEALQLVIYCGGRYTANVVYLACGYIATVE